MCDVLLDKLLSYLAPLQVIADYWSNVRFQQGDFSL